MEIKEYFACENRENFLKQLESCDWSAGKFLAKIIKDNRFEQTLGGWAKLFLLVANDALVSFVTLSAQDCIDDPEMTPWLGFLHTAAEYRGNRYGKLLIDYACNVASNNGYDKVYLATDYVGLYEKYGFKYVESRIDVYNEQRRIYVKEIQ